MPDVLQLLDKDGLSFCVKCGIVCEGVRDSSLSLRMTNRKSAQNDKKKMMRMTRRKSAQNDKKGKIRISLLLMAFADAFVDERSKVSLVSMLDFG